eukprot:m.15489 g.15489  ORF g.15489 m.15489 type:complete len:412 (-) comp4919_c0_seq1:130-1365(-)
MASAQKRLREGEEDDPNVVNLMLLPKLSDNEVLASAANSEMRATRGRTQKPSFAQREKARTMQHLDCLEDVARRGTIHTLILNPTSVALEWTRDQAEVLERALVACAAFLVHLDLDPHCCNMPYRETVSMTVAGSCSKLRFLNAFGCPWSRKGLEVLAKTATDLRCLRLGGIAVSVQKPLPTDALRHLASLHQLRELSIENTGITDESLIEIVRGGCGAHLTHLDLTSSDQITEDAIEIVSETCPKLSTISLLNCESVGASGVRSLGSHCHELADVNLQRVRGATAGVQALCTGCSGLSRLVLSVCTLLDEDLDMICASLQNLSELDLNGVSGPGYKSYMKIGRLSSLKRLELNGLRLPEAKMLQVCTAIAEGCPLLEYLGLNNSSATSACVAVVNEALPQCDIKTINCKW